MSSKWISFRRSEHRIFLGSQCNLWTKSSHFQNILFVELFWFHDDESCSLAQLHSFVLVWKRNLVFQYWSPNLTSYLLRSSCLNFAPFWGSLRESTCRYHTLPTTPLEKVVKHSIIQVGTQYRLAKLLIKLPALLLYSFLVLGNGKSFIFKLFS